MPMAFVCSLPLSKPQNICNLKILELKKFKDFEKDFVNCSYELLLWIYLVDCSYKLILWIGHMDWSYGLILWIDLTDWSYGLILWYYELIILFHIQKFNSFNWIQILKYSFSLNIDIVNDKVFIHYIYLQFSKKWHFWNFLKYQIL